MGINLNFEAHDHPLKDVLFSNWKFKIPRYQRFYTWDEDQLSDFWLDLTSDDGSYFFGSFILNREFEKKTGYIEIVDGQQRILTITIFMAVLRDIFETLDQSIAELIQRKDIAHEDRSGRYSYRIECSESSKNFFEKYIQSKKININESNPSTPEEKRIKKNYEFLHKLITNEYEKRESTYSKREYLNNLRERVADLLVIKIEIDSEEAAYEIFETTNARGVDLSIADLLKNLIFKHIRNTDKRDLAKEIWTDIIKNIQETSTEMKRFIRYYWISKYSMVTEKNLFKSIKQNIKNWKLLIENLKNASIQYNLLLEGERDDWENIKHGAKIFKSVNALKFMNVSQCYVLLLSILRNYDKLGTNPLRIFQIIEKFTFNYSVICKLPANKVEKIYSKYAREIEKIVNDEIPKKISGCINRVFSELENDLKNENPSFELFSEKFREISYSNFQQKRMLIKYILTKINSYKQTGEFKIDFDNVNIEHILPQKPSKDWKLTKDAIKEYVNLLGNLTLVHKAFNSKAGNKSLQEKVKELKKSEITITKDLIEKIKKIGTWGEDEIINRQNELAEIAYKKIWSL
jgi:uncharacterized protein with ParB-like and HNH nuclease domain